MYGAVCNGRLAVRRLSRVAAAAAVRRSSAVATEREAIVRPAAAERSASEPGRSEPGKRGTAKGARPHRACGGKKRPPPPAMQPAKRRNGSDPLLCGAPAKKVPEPPVSDEDPNRPSLLKAFEAILAAGRRGLLGPTARAAAEALPDGALEGNEGEADQEPPGPAPPLEEEEGGEEEQQEEEEQEEEEQEEEEEDKKEKEGEKKELEEGKDKGKSCHTVVKVTPPVAGTGDSKPCIKEIWITGDSVISLSMKRAQFSRHGKHLGLPSSTACVTWRGFPEMMWDDLLPFLHGIYHKRPDPSMMIIHLGGMDLWKDSSSSLVIKMQNDLDVLQRAFPDATIVWSSLLPNPVCKTSEELQNMESKRSKVNSEMEKYCNENCICYLLHPLFTIENKALFLPNNTLTNEGADIFITDLKEIMHTYGP